MQQDESTLCRANQGMWLSQLQVVSMLVQGWWIEMVALYKHAPACCPGL